MSYTASFDAFDATFDGKGDVTLALIAKQVMAMVSARRERIRSRNRARLELQQYSDRQLNEIGLARGDIEDVVHGRFKA